MSLLKRIRETSVAQLAHYAWGALIPMYYLKFAAFFAALGMFSVGWLLFFTIGIPALKEFIECIPYHGRSLAPWETEGIQSISDGFLDFMFFMLGFASLLV